MKLCLLCKKQWLLSVSWISREAKRLATQFEAILAKFQYEISVLDLFCEEKDVCFWSEYKRKLKMGGPPKSQESIVIYLSKPTFWQKHEMILWPIASICPWHFVKNVREKVRFLATSVFSKNGKHENAWNLRKTHPRSRFPAIGHVKKLRMLSVLHISLVESSPTL